MTHYGETSEPMMCALQQIQVYVILVLKFLVLLVFLQQVSEEQSYCKSVVNKEKESQLCRLPRHHPLVRELQSDDGA